MSNCCVRVVCGMIGGEGDDGVCKRGFPVYGGPHVCGGSVYGYVKVVQGVAFFCFCCEL